MPRRYRVVVDGQELGLVDEAQRQILRIDQLRGIRFLSIRIKKTTFNSQLALPFEVENIRQGELF